MFIFPTDNHQVKQIKKKKKKIQITKKKYFQERVGGWTGFQNKMFFFFFFFPNMSMDENAAATMTTTTTTIPLWSWPSGSSNCFLLQYLD